jgi:hypothetical protein
MSRGKRKARRYDRQEYDKPCGADGLMGAGVTTNFNNTEYINDRE